MQIYLKWLEKTEKVFLDKTTKAKENVRRAVAAGGGGGKKFFF